MNKKQFDDIFRSTKLKIIEKVNSNMKENLLKISDESGKISTSELAVFVLSQSMEYTNDMIYSILSKALVTEDKI